MRFKKKGMREAKGDGKDRGWIIPGWASQTPWNTGTFLQFMLYHILIFSTILMLDIGFT